jgi:hypothetical protein
MNKQNKNSGWNPFASQWIWAFILGSELVVFFALKALVGSAAYFLLGPVLVYNLGIYFFPYLYFFFKPPQSFNNRFALQWKADLKELFPAHVRIHFLLKPEGQSPLMAFSHGSTLWVTSSENFLERFSAQEAALLQKQLFYLWKSGHLLHATTWTALQSTLPLWLVRNPRGTELMFAAAQNDAVRPQDWLPLCIKVYHWMSHQADTTSKAMSPSLFFPNLTNYNEKSYFSLYQYLQQELIESIKEGDMPYEPTKSGSFVFNPDPFHRLDGSDGPRPGPTPSDRPN